MFSKFIFSEKLINIICKFKSDINQTYMSSLKQNIVISTDIGGSHISCAAVDIDKGRILEETFCQKDVNNQAHAGVIISVWADALRTSMEKVQSGDIKGIGFAIPGPFDYVKGICLIRNLAKYENLYGFNIGDAIRSSLEFSDEFPVRFMNDASSFAVGEAWKGKASGFTRSLSITLGTGFGSAFINNRIPVVEGDEVPRLGCVYHLPFKGGIAEDLISTRWFLKSYKNITGNEIQGVKELSQIAISDNIALSLFDEFGQNMGIFLAPWLKKFRAEVLVIGGNISNAYSLFKNSFEETLKQEKCNCKVEISELKENAALLGSAYLFNEDFWKAVQPALPLM